MSSQNTYQNYIILIMTAWLWEANWQSLITILTLDAVKSTP